HERSPPRRSTLSFRLFLFADKAAPFKPVVEALWRSPTTGRHVVVEEFYIVKKQLPIFVVGAPASLAQIVAQYCGQKVARLNAVIDITLDCFQHPLRDHGSLVPA